jgi:hypothetical protein
MSSGLSPLAATLADVVAAHPRVRVPIETLRQALVRADLSFVGAPDARDRLRDAIDELEQAALVQLPKGRGGWDAAVAPRLPRWVARPLQRAAPPAPAPDVAWHAQLNWVPAFLAHEHPSIAERSVLRAVNRFLGAGGGVRTAPLRERSLELLGDEKALDVFVRGRLFAPGRLTLDHIAATRVSPPLVAQRIGEGPTWLVVENYTTAHTLGALLPADGAIGTVVYGAGNQIGQLLPQIADAGPAALAYFGDLDIRGLEIAVAAGRTAADLGLPPLRPAVGLYRLLLDVGTPQPAGAVPAPRRLDAACAWLPETVHDDTAQLLRTGHRLAQEAVGVEVLVRAPRWSESATFPEATR